MDTEDSRERTDWPGWAAETSSRATSRDQRVSWLPIRVLASDGRQVGCDRSSEWWACGGKEPTELTLGADVSASASSPKPPSTSMSSSQPEQPNEMSTQVVVCVYSFIDEHEIVRETFGKIYKTRQVRPPSRAHLDSGIASP